MKFVGAYSIAGSVTRLVPKRSEDKEVKLYYEFMDFYQISLNCDVTFSKEGSYRKLLELMGRNPEEKWDDETRMMFRSTYGRFAKAFELAKGDRLDLTCGDAFLIYLELTGYEETKGQTEREMYGALKQMWEEIQLVSRGSQVALVENPDELEGQKKNNLFNWILPSGKIEPEMLTIGFIHAKTGATSSWTYAHELGRMHLEQVFEGKMKTMAFEQVNTEEETEKAIEDAIAAGCNTIFTTASEMVNQSVRSAIRHPEVRIYNCSIRMSYSSICTYYARMYEAKFLTGAIAAAMSRCDDLGYIADYPVYGNIANINAFAMGARMINPDVEVHLEWSRLKGADPEEWFKEQGIRYISGADMIVPEHRSREFGLYRKLEDGTVENIAMPVWHWGKFYERIVRNICQGIDTEAMKGKKAVNYWWGLSADVVDLIMSTKLPVETQRMVTTFKEMISKDLFEPFADELKDQKGKVRNQKGRNLTPEQIITMDWLLDNVIGKIPELEELEEGCEPIVKAQGIIHHGL